MRLMRSRKGKTPIDVTKTQQNGLPRVRVSIGKDSENDALKVNSDLDYQELDAFITMLMYMKAVVFEGLEEDDNGISED